MKRNNSNNPDGVSESVSRSSSRYEGSPDSVIGNGVSSDRYTSTMIWNHHEGAKYKEKEDIIIRRRVPMMTDRSSGIWDNTPQPLNINLKDGHSHNDDDGSGTFSLSEQTGLRMEKIRGSIYNSNNDNNNDKRCSSVNENVLQRHLTIAYRWISHFVLGINQLAAGDVLSTISFVLVRKEAIDHDNTGEVPTVSDGNVGPEIGIASCCENEARCQMDGAFTLISGLTDLYGELAYSQLMTNHQGQNIEKKVDFPSPSPSCSSLKMYSPFVSPGQLQLDIVPMVMVPCQELFDELVSHIRMMESVLTDTRRTGTSYPKHHNRVAEVDETVPAYPLLDPRMPWNGRLWLPGDLKPISSLPVGISREIQGLIDSVEVGSDRERSQDYTKLCKLLVPCSSPNYFLVADKLYHSGASEPSLLVKKDIEINKLRWAMAEKKNELNLECEETERLRSRLAAKSKEVDSLRRSRQLEMKRRVSLRTENFDLKRLCDKYEELLGDLRSLVFVQSVYHSDSMKEVARVLEEPLHNRTMNSTMEVTPQEVDSLHATLSDWTVPEESSGVATATLRLMGEFDSVVDSAAEEIDRYRTAYQIDRARKERDAVRGTISGTSRNSSEDQYLLDELSMRRPPSALDDVEEPGLHFGMSYKNFGAVSASHKAMCSEGAHVIDTPEVFDNPELYDKDESSADPAEVSHHLDGREIQSTNKDEATTSAEMLIGMLGRKLRRYEVLLEATSKSISESLEEEEEDVDMMATAKELSMTSWCILKHVGERLIEVVANDEKKKNYKSFRNLWKMNRKVRRRSECPEFDATNEKEKLLISVNRVIHRLYPSKPSPVSTSTLLESVKFPRRRSEGCSSVNEIIIELWDCLAFLAGAHPIAPPPLALPGCILEGGDTAITESQGLEDATEDRERELHSYWPQAYNRPMTDTSFRDTGSEEPPPQMKRNSSMKRTPSFTVKRSCSAATEKTPIIRREATYCIGGKMKRIEESMMRDGEMKRLI